MFTVAAQRQLPHLVIASPKDEQELRSLLRTALAQEHPFALHYPRDPGFGLPAQDPVVLPIGQGETLRDGRELLFVGFGPIVMRAMEAAAALEADGWSIGVINARFAKPLDRQLILDAARGKQLVVTFEESVVSRRLRVGRARIDRGSSARGSGVPRRRRAGHRDPRRSFRRSRVGGRPAPDAASGRAGSCRAGARDPDAAQAFAWTVDLGRRLNPP